MKLDALLASLPCGIPESDSYPEITSLAYDSRKACEGALFFCLRGALTDGHLFAKNAYENGCRAFLAEQPLDLPDDAIVVRTGDTRAALSSVSAVFFGRPAEKLKLIGVTGTKGKTSVATLIYETMRRAGINAGLIGTTGIRFADVERDTVNSTPESYELQKTFSEMVSSGVRYAVMEVSSQSYLTGRVSGLAFEIGVFTNLSPDHIGKNEHPDYGNYRECKSMLFSHAEISLLNADDKESAYMAKKAKGTVLYYSDGPDADYIAEKICPGKGDGKFGTSFVCKKRGEEERPFFIPVPGRFNVLNALAVIAVCDLVGIGFDLIRDSLKTAGVPGRFEQVETVWKDRVFLIDYAHNELSLRSILETLRASCQGRLICLFGSVGGRTQLRRAKMGEVASSLADLCILTSDNPDFESPEAIIEDIAKGCGKRENYIKIPDRKKAIGYAVRVSAPGDVILFAGKGHEKYQLIEGKKIPFLEKDVIREEIGKLISTRTGKR